PRPRDDLAVFPAYRTGQQKADVRLNANEWAEPNPAGDWLTPQELDAVLLNRYPSSAVDLRGLLAERYRVEPDQLVLGNGSNEVLLNTFLVFGGHGRRTLLFQPTYSMHARLTVIAGGTVVDEVIGLPYDISRERAVAAAAKARADIIVFTTPNNPTGNEVPFDAILAVAEAHPETLVLVDEAYSDFAGTTLLPELAAHPNMVISKTFSKVRAAAGLRVGILVTHPAVAELFRAVQLPYNVSSLTHAVAGKIAKDDASISRRVEQCHRERGRVFAALTKIRAIEAFPSVTNFVLFRVNDEAPAAVHARFLEQSVLIRDISMWPGCAGCLRVSIGTPAENDRFIAALDHVFAAAPA
ncbi:MAG TPA: aminotransferase class I/II-fold pyridoxal phosphate-dependent enzyme, partial [Candidatus Limnocylindria bacterium]|nr:aminotransferase class I/II-fold pyridoxal phosphate-dependent enzyme [Candidatus Limnocylindria bacterium]